jgi:magnesium chelatase family protein
VLAKVAGCALAGLEGALVEVEVDVESRGLPSLAIVGLPDEAVKESRERVRSAIINSDLTYPRHRTTVNLAAADLRKEGLAYYLPHRGGAANSLGTDSARPGRCAVRG